MAREERGRGGRVLLLAGLIAGACASPSPRSQPEPVPESVVWLSREAVRWIAEHATDCVPMIHRKAAWLHSHGAAGSMLWCVTLADGRELWITRSGGAACLSPDVNRDDYIPEVEARPDIRW